MEFVNSKGRTKIAENRVTDFIRDLSRSFITDTVPFDCSVYVTPDRLNIGSTFNLSRKPIEKGTRWGSNWESGYFLLNVEIPSYLKGKELAIRMNLGGEMLIYDNDGNPQYGLTGGSVFDGSYYKDMHRLGKYNKDTLSLYVETAANNLFGLKREEKKLSRNMVDPEGRWDGVLHYAEIGRFNENVWKLYLASEFLFSIYKGLDNSSVRASRILRALFNASLDYTVNDEISAYKKLEVELEKQASASALRTTVIGHAHIDSAWLWPIAETHRKVARTYSSQIDNIDKYPSYVFGSSSPQHYQWTKDEHPALYEKIKKAVGKGRWELLGAMWIEPDCTLTSSESLIRQILEGKKFFKKEFGKDVRICWIPDTFGYPANLPQILKKSGIDYFSTQKISWSSYTDFPYDSFLWKGIDGTEVLTHFLPEHTYNSDGLAVSLMKAEHDFKEKDFLDEFVTAVGIGDGGGGPKEEHIERILLASDSESVPQASFGFVEDYFGRLESHVDELSVYSGELYLQLHRGTLTSQAANKKNNRIFEESLRVLEFLFASERNYPLSRMEKCIRDGLLMQFHDILPGSCIGPVYKETADMYGSLFDEFKNLTAEYLDRYYPSWTSFSSAFASVEKDNKGNYLNIFDIYGKADSVLVRLPLVKEGILDDSYPVEKLGSSSYSFVPVDGRGWSGFAISEQIISAVENRNDLILENGNIRYVFSSDGHMISAVDMNTGFDYLLGSEGNSLHLYADTPQNWEAWDIEFYYPEQELLEVSCISHEKIYDNVIKFKYSIGSASEIEQYAVLNPKGREVYFITSAEWQEERRLLRVDFPVDPLADKANCDISYGIFDRECNVRTEEDAAMFEFSARGYVNVDNIAVACDSKYGYSCRDGRLGLSLLRSPIDPDPYADLGHHDFIYAYIPHSEKLEESSVKRISDALNSPSFAVITEEKCTKDGIAIAIDSEKVSLAVVKKAEDGKGIVLRCVENYGSKVKVKLSSTGLRFYECDLLEQKIGDAVYGDGDILEFNPFEIRTFREVL